MKATIEVDGKKGSERFSFTPGFVYTVGRVRLDSGSSLAGFRNSNGDAKCIPIEDEAISTVSRRHATLTLLDEGLRVLDLGSSSGTYVFGYDSKRNLDGTKHVLGQDDSKVLGPGNYGIAFGNCLARVEVKDGRLSSIKKLANLLKRS